MLIFRVGKSRNWHSAKHKKAAFSSPRLDRESWKQPPGDIPAPTQILNMSTKRKAATAIAKPVVKQNAKAPTKTRIDESRTAVSTGLALKPVSTHIEEPIESDSESRHSASEDDEEVSGDEGQSEEKETEADSGKQKPAASEADGDAVMQDNGEASDGEPTSPTFGDLVRGTTTVDVSASLAAQTTRHEVQRSTAPISATSLGTVLNQALRTDDSDLLESCLQTNDLLIIQNTINRMDSSLAGTLLSKLAARMHRRPGRAFGLMRWIQWTLVAHGGALVTQPDLINRLTELSRVLEERSRGLSSLLALKGKLDMLDAQLKYRKALKMAGSSRNRPSDDDESSAGEEDDADEPAVVYVEGQENLGNALPNGRSARHEDEDEDKQVQIGDMISDSEEDSEDDIDSEAEDDIEEIESIDDEDEVDHDDVEEDEEEEEEDSEAEDAPPAKVRRTSARLSTKRK